mmetsp:Transcript_19400/g.77469  ORF Transcript_19400/g.77469 Transcript_19400/m.77469 type:complete len:151 (+) Transcript_19400:835-1287(+)
MFQERLSSAITTPLVLIKSTFVPPGRMANSGRHRFDHASQVQKHTTKSYHRHTSIIEPTAWKSRHPFVQNLTILFSLPFAPTNELHPSDRKVWDFSQAHRGQLHEQGPIDPYLRRRLPFAHDQGHDKSDCNALPVGAKNVISSSSSSWGS